MASAKTIADLIDAKNQNKKISAVTCYDYTTARLVQAAGIDMVLVGDSAAQLILGHNSTLPATMEFLLTLTKAVRKGAPETFLVADMPFLSYQPSTRDAILNAGRFVAEAGAQMVKIEAAAPHIPTIKAVSDAGIAVMAHIGIRPQSISKIGRFKAEATTAEMALDLINLAKQMTNAGAAALLIEGTAAEVARIITENSPIPTISCGSGPHCAGQILVINDILGLTDGPKPKFAKQFTDLAGKIKTTLQAYDQSVKQQKYPTAQHCYHMKKGQLTRLKSLLP